MSTEQLLLNHLMYDLRQTIQEQNQREQEKRYVETILSEADYWRYYQQTNVQGSSLKDILMNVAVPVSTAPSVSPSLALLPYESSQLNWNYHPLGAMTTTQSSHWLASQGPYNTGGMPTATATYETHPGLPGSIVPAAALPSTGQGLATFPQIHEANKSSPPKLKWNNFPTRLMKALLLYEQQERTSSSPIFQWLPDGRSFAVLDQDAFEQVILPHAMKGNSKYCSFVRKTSRWGFSRRQFGSLGHVFYNESFARGNFEECAMMRCSGSLVK